VNSAAIAAAARRDNVRRDGGDTLPPKIAAQ